MTLADVRRFWDERPCNVRHSKVDIDLCPLTYNHEVMRRKYFVEPHIPIFSQFRWWRGKRVLDAGCGIGTMAISFAQAGAQVVAVDISGKSVEIARKRAAALGIEEDKLRFVVSPIEKLSRHLPTAEPFDLVYSFGVIHHTPYPCAALLELRQLIAPGGAMKLMLYNRRSWKVLWILLNYWRGQHPRNLSKFIQKFSEAQTGCPVTHTYTEKSAAALLRDCGFTVVKMEIDHIFPYRIPAYVEGRYEKEWYWRMLPARVFRWLERRFGWHILIDAVCGVGFDVIGG
jgi:2-polyprenyl-3-methyl-5-hydroxy-6-metoxy-1,4-benzoquinol methylase